MGVSLEPFKRVVDRDSPLPVYRQVERWLRTQIETGAFHPEEMLPSTKVLCKTLGGINHLTIRQAMMPLVREGLLYSIQGKGTFVRERKARQSRIGLVLPNLDEELTQEIAKGVQEVLDREDQVTKKACASTVILNSGRSPQKELDSISELENLPLDGAIILPISYGDLVERLVRLKIHNFPFVLIDWVVPGIKFSAVYCNHYDGTYRITWHLLEEGRRNLAWVGRREDPSARLRYDGFRDAMNDFGVVCQRDWLLELVVPMPAVLFEKVLDEALEKFLARYPQIDALVCLNDFEALSCLKVLRQRGIRVPEKLAVVGFDDLTGASVSVPPLTTVRQPIREMGSRAAELILKRISQNTLPPQEIVLPVELVIRNSSLTTPVKPAS